jgi:endoglucanase
LDIKTLAKELSQIPAPSGFEREAGAKIAELLKPFADEVRTDVLGNVIGIKRCGKPTAPKLLLDAHMDETGFVVTELCGGFLRFSALGKYDPRLLPGGEALIMAERPLYGVIGCLPPHILSEEEKEKPVEIKNLFIDTGLSQKEAERLIPVGTPGVFLGDFFEMEGGSFAAKALDDRLGVAVLLKVMENIRASRLDFDVCFMASVQEEAGARGAGPEPSALSRITA